MLVRSLLNVGVHDFVVVLMRIRVAGVLGLAIIFSNIGRPAFGQPPSKSATDLPANFDGSVKKVVEEERARSGAPAMSVAVFANGRTPVVYASGMADAEAHIPATPETLFQAASVTKLLTAALVMHEVERDELSLDAPVNDLLPAQRQVRDSTGTPVPVTLRQLLSHSSGLGVSGGIQRDANGGPISLDATPVARTDHRGARWQEIDLLGRWICLGWMACWPSRG